MEEAGTPGNSIRSYVQIVKNDLKHGARKGLCGYPAWAGGSDGRKDRPDGGIPEDRRP